MWEGGTEGVPEAGQVALVRPYVHCGHDGGRGLVPFSFSRRLKIRRRIYCKTQNE